jgi:hypothetical protein
MTDPVEERAYRRPRLSLLLLTTAAIIALLVVAFVAVL